jgi:hypothetical protein
MTTTVITNSGSFPYGQMTNQAIGRLISLNTTLSRLKEAIAIAALDYQGVEGTEYELRSGGAVPVPANTTNIPTLFGVVPSNAPGEQGVAYRYAMETLYQHWAVFWAAAQPFIEQLDNGAPSM